MIVTLSACLTGTADADVRCRSGATVADALAAAGLEAREVWHGRELVTPATRIDGPEVGHAARLTARPAAGAWSGRGARLVSVLGPDAGHSIAVDAPVALGSLTPGLRDPAVSAVHARATPRTGGLRLSDLASENGLARVDVWRRGRTVASLRLSPGGRVALGRTIVELRAGGPPPRAVGRRDPGTFERLLRVPGRARRHPRQADRSLAPPDPTALAESPRLGGESAALDTAADEWWDGAISVTGPRAVEAWRALVLARGRAPHGDRPEEPWLAWVPQADPLREPPCGIAEQGTAPTASDGLTSVHAREDRWEVAIDGQRSTLPPCHVSREAAEGLARAIARATPPPPVVPAWADLMPDRYPGIGATTRTPIGAWASDGAPWELPRGQPWTLLAVGTSAQPRASLLEIIAGACAWGEDPSSLRIVIVGDSREGPLARVRALPHVVHAASSRDALGALETAAALAGSGRLPLVLVDDAASLAPAAARALEGLMLGAGGTHPARVAIASPRTAGVYSPAALAGARWLVALDDAAPHHAADLVGAVPHAGPPARSRAWVRTAGAVREAFIARATATRTPPAWPGRGDPPPGEDLCASAAARWRS